MLYYYGIKLIKRFQCIGDNTIKKENEQMGTLVCQTCNSTIDHFDDEKVTVLYAKCNCCNHEQHNEEK